MNNNLMNEKYNTFYESILNRKSKSDIQFVILTHLVSDIIEFISAVKKIGDVALIIAIPYSKEEIVYRNLSEEYITISPKLNDLLNGSYLVNTVLKHINPSTPFIIVEIGGYFANAVFELYKKTNGNLLGIVEDTEAGHRKYELVNTLLPCPVLSVARSQLKDAENFLVSSSCIKAATMVLNATSFEYKNKKALVLGYGKIGQGICQLLKEKKIHVSTYDVDPAKRLLALSRGYAIPEKAVALKESDLIFGATGFESIRSEDICNIKNNAFLISCSSKHIEFNLDFIKRNFINKKINCYVDQYENKNQQFYLIGDGRPVNFSCGKVLVGPMISIVHGEMLAAISELSSGRYKNQLQEIPNEIKKQLAENWIDVFCNASTGTILHESN